MLNIQIMYQGVDMNYSKLKHLFKHNLVYFRLFILLTSVPSQPEVSKYCAELMPLLLGYLSSLNQAKVGHVTKAFYALENFMENLGKLKKQQFTTEPVKKRTNKRHKMTQTCVYLSNKADLVLIQFHHTVLQDVIVILSMILSSKVHFHLLFLSLWTGADIEPYLPTLMETMLSALNNTENLKIKELAVSAIGAIGKKIIIVSMVI